LTWHHYHLQVCDKHQHSNNQIIQQKRKASARARRLEPGSGRPRRAEAKDSAVGGSGRADGGRRRGATRLLGPSRARRIAEWQRRGGGAAQYLGGQRLSAWPADRTALRATAVGSGRRIMEARRRTVGWRRSADARRTVGRRHARRTDHGGAEADDRIEALDGRSVDGRTEARSADGAPAERLGRQ
jgi:hypothetical protein